MERKHLGDNVGDCPPRIRELVFVKIFPPSVELIPDTEGGFYT